MKNFIFISPNFPTNYWQFCHELKNNGMNVLGIGDQPYHELTDELKGSLNEYYKVSSLENEDEVYRAVAFLIFFSLYTPCVATISAINKEFKSTFFTLEVILFQTSLAWLIACFFYQTLTLL